MSRLADHELQDSDPSDPLRGPTTDGHPTGVVPSQGDSGQLEFASQADAEARVRELERRARETIGTLPCGGCGGPHRFDTTVPSVIWNTVIRAKGLSEYLCASCILREFVLAGRSFTATLYNGDEGFHGQAIEVRVGGQVADDATRVSEENTALRWKLHEVESTVEALAGALEGLLESIPHHEGDDNLTEPIERARVALASWRGLAQREEGGAWNLKRGFWRWPSCSVRCLAGVCAAL